MSLNRSLRAQVLSLIGGSLLLMLSIGLSGAHLLSGQLQDYQDLLKGPLQASELINEANLQFKTQVQEWKNVLLRGRKGADLDKYWANFEAQEHKVQALLEQLRTLEGIGPEIKGQIQQLQTNHKQLGEGYRKGREEFLRASADPFAGDHAVKGIDRATSDLMSQLVEQLLKNTHQQTTNMATTESRTRWMVSLLLVGGCLIIALFSISYINRALIQPIQDLIQKTTLLSQGHLSGKIQIQRKDELGELAVAIGKLQGFLQETFDQLGRGAQSLANTSNQLQQVAHNLSQGTEHQSEQTELATTAVGELSLTAGEMARYTQEASQATNHAEEAARRGDSVMGATIDTIGRVREEIGATAQVIHQLEQDSNRITKVLDVIRNIAEQTNLLALNAAIEAARAGEAGRGFAVVADEVRTLASRTAESTAEINQIIDTVQKSALNAVTAIEAGQSRTEEGVAQVEQAGHALQEIITAIRSIRDMNQQIANAAAEQTNTAQHISHNMQEITRITQVNQSGVQKTEAASQDLQVQSSQLSQVVARLTRH